MKQIGRITALALCAALVLSRWAIAQTAPLVTATERVQVRKAASDVPSPISGNTFGNIDIAAAGTTPETVKA